MAGGERSRLRELFAGARGRLLGALLLAEFAASVTGLSYSAVLPVAAAELSGLEFYGAAVTATGIVGIAFLGFGAYLYGRIGAQAQLLISTMVLIAGVVMSATASTMWVLVVGLALRGVAAGLMGGLGMGVISDVYPDAKQRERVFHDPSAVGVDDGGAVDPPVFRAMLRDVAEPQAVRRDGLELPLHEVLVGCGVRLPPTPLATMRDSDQTVQSHQSRDAFAGDMDAESDPQFGEHPRGAVGLSRVGVYASDRGRQLRIRDRASRWRPVRPVVVAGRRDLQEPAGHRDGDAVCGELLDQPEPYFGSTFSLAK